MKFQIMTLGCKVNQAESSGFAQLLLQRGMTQAETAEQAELRREYLAEYRENMKAMLDNLIIQEQDGTRHALKQKDNPPVQ